MRSKPEVSVIRCWHSADDPLRPSLPARRKRHYGNNQDLSGGWAYNKSKTNNDKAKPVKRRGRKATGPRFLREAMEDLPKEPRSPDYR